MGAVLGKCMGQLDDKKLTMAIDKGFDFFDKDKSGSLDAAEAREAAGKALALAGPLGGKVTPEQIDGAFNKVAGEDKKMDKEEFGTLIRGLVEKAGGPKAAPAGAAATTAAPTAAAAAADAPAAAAPAAAPAVTASA